MLPKAEILNECDRYFTPSLYHAREEVRFFDPRSRIKPRWKTHTAFRVIDFGRNEMSLGQLDREASYGDLIQIDSKEKEEVHAIHSLQSPQIKNIVHACHPT